jgi:hypothetical protein
MKSYLESELNVTVIRWIHFGFIVHHSYWSYPKRLKNLHNYLNSNRISSRVHNCYKKWPLPKCVERACCHSPREAISTSKGVLEAFWENLSFHSWSQIHQCSSVTANLWWCPWWDSHRNRSCKWFWWQSHKYSSTHVIRALLSLASILWPLRGDVIRYHKTRSTMWRLWAELS